MSQILHFFKESLSSSASESSRYQSLMRGLPAILVAIVALSAIAWASFGNKDELERDYRQRAAESKKEKLQLVKDLRTHLRILQASRGTNSNEGPLIPADDERRVKLDEVQNEERIYLEKLISLNPDEFDYRFELALVSFEQRDLQRGLALMQQSAPVDEPGYAKAHFWLAKYYLKLKTESLAEQRRNRSLALTHVEHSLTRRLDSDEDTKMAKVIKAQLLSAQGRQEAAYEIFEELFANDVAFYRPMLQLNRALGREERNAEILDTAIREFRFKLGEEELSIEEWVAIWNNIFKCLKETKDFAGAEEMLKRELELQVNSSDGPAKQKFIEQMLSNIYFSLAASLPVEARSERIEALKLAYQFNPISSEVMTELTKFVIGNDPTLAEAARQVYDPVEDPDAPAAVLNALGSDALKNAEYEAAIRYYELARKRSPRNAAILNNLAYAYLVCENRNPERALRLVDEAIRSLENNPEAKIARSNFYDTRGAALMQMNRMTEAAAAFEIAIQDRPNNRQILESLVKCYEGNNLSPGIYLDRLKKLDEQNNASSGDSPNNPPNGPLEN